jgi:hypothetical protein
MRNSADDSTIRTRENPVSAMTGHDLPAAMRASDADRDAVVSDLSEHFQAGRLTKAEFDERTGQALTARTWGELRELLADLPRARTAGQIPAAGSPSVRTVPSPRRGAPPILAPLAGFVVVALVLGVATGGWGLIWLLFPALVIARRVACFSGASGRCGPRN